MLGKGWLLFMGCKCVYGKAFFGRWEGNHRSISFKMYSNHSLRLAYNCFVISAALTVDLFFPLTFFHLVAPTQSVRPYFDTKAPTSTKRTQRARK